jgi:hypothetical protein
MESLKSPMQGLALKRWALKISWRLETITTSAGNWLTAASMALREAFRNGRIARPCSPNGRRNVASFRHLGNELGRTISQ